jgi:cytochrome c-type biogenesis protein CcmH
MIAVFVPMMTMLLYLQLGMHNASDESYIASRQQAQQRQAQPSAQPSVADLVQRLEQKIQESGGTVQEWIMLARSHKYLQKYELADKAFAVALEQDKENAQLMLERAEVMALGNNQNFSPEARDLVRKAYEIQPDNANALWFAGIAEFQYGNYRLALDRLTRLLPLVGDDQAVINSVMEVIAKSREQLVAAGEDVPELEELVGIKPMAKADSSAKVESAATTPASSTTLQVNVDVSGEVREKFGANDAVFVYAKAVQGPRMPLAVKRMTLAELPATVVLDDSMAMMEGMNLSAFEQLEVSARLTKSGAAIAQSGDYIGRFIVEDKVAQSSLKIVIDTLVP